MALSTANERTLRVCALYPDLMNIYADRGNLLVLQRRCEWRDISFELEGSGLGESLHGDAHDVFYIGGGQDRDQQLCAEDLLQTKRASLHQAAARGAVVLGICGGYQLLGHSYTLGEQQIEGVGLLDVQTVRDPGPRLIGNVAIEVSLEGANDRRVLAQGSRTMGRTHPSRLGRPSSRARHEGSRQRRPLRLGGRPAGNNDRHLPARPAPAQEHLVR